MNLWIAYAALGAGVLVWSLLVRKLRTRSWETPGSREPLAELRMAPAWTGLWVFLGVVTSLFSLFIAAYFMRMGYGHGAGHGISDWHSVAKPRILWFNTLTLLLSSATMQAARTAVAGGLHRRRAQRVFISGGVLALLFLSGQLIAWQQLSASGYLASSSPAVAFFFVLTAVHGLHLLGGLWVWSKTLVRKFFRGVELQELRLSVELCAVYWHYLLIVWLVLFGVLLAT